MMAGGELASSVRMAAVWQQGTFVWRLAVAMPTAGLLHTRAGGRVVWIHGAAKFNSGKREITDW